MKINKCFLYVAAIFTMVCCSISYASNESQFGYVNVADAMLLHPTMRHFDPSAKRFKVEALKSVNQEKRVEEDKIKYKEQRNKLEKELDNLKNERVELEKQYISNSRKYNVSTEKLSKLNEKQLQQFNEKKKELDRKYFNDADELRKKIYKAKQTLENFEKSSNYTGLTTQGETNHIFSLMLDDIYDAMGAVATHYKVSFVFNSSAEIAFIQGRMASVNPLNDFFNNFDQTVQDKDGKKITGAAFTAWLNEKNSTFINCNDRRLTSFVMMGGLNMTPAIIDYIYQKYKIGKDQREFIIEYFNKIANSEN